MFKRILCPLFAVILLVVTSGCMEEAALLSVNKDGSGTIKVRSFLSPQLTQMMEGMGGAMSGMMEGMTEGLAEGEEPPKAEKMDFAAMMKDGATEKAASMGEGVSLTDFKPATNKAGWKGYTATYAFTDINNVTLALGDATGGDEESDEGETSMSGDTAYTFEFAKGDPAVLKIMPVADEEEDEEGASEGAEPAEGEEGEMEMEMEGMEMAGMEQMMAPMLAGMRLALFVKVEGDIQETNSRYASDKHKNLITVMDMKMDEVIKNKDAFKLIAGEDPEAESKLQEMNLPGVKLEDPEKVIEVKF